MSTLKTYGDDVTFAPSRTYRLVGNRVMGMIDGKNAVLQAIELILGAERWRYEMFSGDYGCELYSLFGESGRPPDKEMELLITEAVTEDDRVNAVENFSVKYEGDTVRISFTAVSCFGDINVERSDLIG